MARAALVTVALCAFTAVDSFVPTCPRVASALTGKCAHSTLNMRPSSSVRSAVSKPVVRVACSELFSATPASNEQTPAPPAPSAVASTAKDVKAPAGTLKVTAYFGLWYLFNIGYNIYNKRVLNVLPLPWVIASSQLGVGLLYVFPLWATKLRKAPKLAKGALGPLR